MLRIRLEDLGFRKRKRLLEMTAPSDATLKNISNWSHSAGRARSNSEGFIQNTSKKIRVVLSVLELVI